MSLTSKHEAAPAPTHSALDPPPHTFLWHLHSMHDCARPVALQGRLAPRLRIGGLHRASRARRQYGAAQRLRALGACHALRAKVVRMALSLVPDLWAVYSSRPCQLD
mmetsp:Transcript_46974/g.123253  ORF Transcript_46974/g.123253 Transcript_46974/m.123253 type:complete len:107 (+) Transcript_46974:36-356(+)